MDLRKQAEMIVSELNAVGAGLGNASVLIVEAALQKYCGPTPVAADMACDYDHIKLAFEGHFTCPVCGAIPPCR